MLHSLVFAFVFDYNGRTRYIAFQAELVTKKIMLGFSRNLRFG